MERCLRVVGGLVCACVLAACTPAPPDDGADAAAGAAVGPAPAIENETSASAASDGGPDDGRRDAGASGMQAGDDAAPEPAPAAPYPARDFDRDAVPVSDASLGAFPFLGLPAGYAPVNRPRERAFARFPFWLGDGVHWVEGRAWSALIGIERGNRDKTFSELELRRNLDGLLEAAGARQVFDGRVARDVYYNDAWGEEIGGGFIEAVNGASDGRTTVHMLRRDDGDVWVQLNTTSRQARMVVVERVAFTPSARWTDTFPYLIPPDGYEVRRRPEQRDFAHFPFWNGTAFEPVEGRSWHSRVAAGDGRQYSMHELDRNVEAIVAHAGGERVFAGTLPPDALAALDTDAVAAHRDGAGTMKDAIRVYRVPRAEGGEVWIQARADTMSGGWVIVEREAFAQSAELLPADALRRHLETDGMAVVHLHFAIDGADILPESQPQLEQIRALLDADPALALAIHGHTDATGDADHNQRLSEARARAVVEALGRAGIDGSRLDAAGFGQSRPVADNGTEAGRAANRRVELVRGS